MTMTLVLAAGVILFLLLLSAFFSGSETALTAVSRPRLSQLDRRGDIAARRALRLTDQPERLIGAILLGNNLVNILASAIATAVFIEVYGQSGVVYATLVMTALVLIFAEVLPKSYALSKPVRVARFVSKPVTITVAILAPIVAAVQFISRRVLILFGTTGSDPFDDLSADEALRDAIDYHLADDTGGQDERAQLGGLLDLKDLDVADIMVHRKSMVVLDVDMEANQLVQRVMRSPYTRIPLWRDNPDNIVGVIHAKDVLNAVVTANGEVESINAKKIVRAPWFVPENTPLSEQLDAFLQKRNHFALVVDEYGVLQGLVTLEDILEEIVGEIADEHDVDIAGVSVHPDGSYQVNGTVAIRELNRTLGWSLPDIEAATTLAGMIIHNAQTIPEKGQVFTFYNMRFEVLKRERNQLTELKVTPIKPLRA